MDAYGNGLRLGRLAVAHNVWGLGRVIRMEYIRIHVSTSREAIWGTFPELGALPWRASIASWYLAHELASNVLKYLNDILII